MDVYWFEQTTADVPANDGWLSAAEIARCNAMRIPKRRADWRLGRWTAKQAVALSGGQSCPQPAFSRLRCLAFCTEFVGQDGILRADWLSAQASLARPSRLSAGSPPGKAAAAKIGRPTDSSTLPSLANIEIRPAPTGAPEVFLSGEPAPVTISLSHSAGVAACALTVPGIALGCDLESVELRSAAFATDYFTPEEQAVATTPRLLTLLWSAKECVLKALHEGLRLDPRSVQVDPAAFSPAGDNIWRPLEARHAGQIFQGWWQQTGHLVRTMLVAQSAPECLRTHPPRHPSR